MMIIIVIVVHIMIVIMVMVVMHTRAMMVAIIVGRDEAAGQHDRSRKNKKPEEQRYCFFLIHSRNISLARAGDNAQNA